MYTKTADLVCIVEAMEELITMMTKGDDMSTQQRIVSVVGFGGLGKTTLAKAVYDKLKGKFDCTAFVPVGRNSNLKKVFKDKSIDLHMNFNVEILDERQLIDKLRATQQIFELTEEQKRYLLDRGVSQSIIDQMVTLNQDRRSELPPPSDPVVGRRSGTL